MSILLRQSTAVDVLIGPFVDDTDGKTAETALTIDVEVSKNGQALANKSDVTAPVHDAAGDIDGYYNCELDATDTGTIGQLTLVCFAAGALYVRHDFQIVPAWYYDMHIAGVNVSYGALQAVTNGANFRLVSGAVATNDRLNGSLAYIVSGTGAGQAPRVIVDSVAADDSVVVDPSFTVTPDTTSYVLVIPNAPAPTNASYLPQVNVGAISGDATAANNAESFFDGTGYAGTNNVIPTVTTVTTLTGHTPQTGDSYALAAGATGFAAIDTVVDAILVDTAVIGAAGAGLTAVPWNAAWDAEVQSEVQDAIEANHLDHLLAADYDPASKPGVATALLNELVESDAGVSRFTANALEEAPTGGSAPTVGEIADAVWDEAATGHTDAGKAGAQLWTDIDAILADTGEIGAAGAGLTEAGGTGDHLTAVPWNAAWDAEVQSECADALTAFAPATEAKQDVIDGIVDSILEDTGTTLPATLSTIAGYLDTEIAAILADTAELQTDLTNGGRLDLLIDAIKAKTDSLTFTAAGEVDANLQSINDVPVVGDGTATLFGV